MKDDLLTDRINRFEAWPILKFKSARRFLRCAAACLCLASCPTVCLAETLLDAIKLAYDTNPDLRGQRAKLRATDETYVQARAGYGPQVSLTGEALYETSRVDLASDTRSSNHAVNYHGVGRSVALSAVQPIYTSGAVRAQVDSASANIAAGRQSLRQTEADLILKVIVAYEDVRLNRETLKVLESEIAALDIENLETKARGEIADLTTTDITQSEARLLAAKAELLAAKGKLNISTAAYLRLVGQNPGELAPPPALPGVPTSVDEAFDAADRDNPELLGAIEAERAAHALINQAKAAFGPSISLRVDAGVAPIEAYIPGQYSRDVTVAAEVTQPLYTSGLKSSKVRQALEEDNLAQTGIETARRDSVKAVAQAWDQLVSTDDVITLQKRQVELEESTVDGYRVQREVGLRTTIELLNAEFELASAQMGLLQSRHDAYIARGSLLTAMGRLELAKISSGAATYNPSAASKRITGRFAPPWIAAVAAIDMIGTASVSQARPISRRDGSAAPASAEHPEVSGHEPATEQ